MLIFQNSRNHRSKRRRRTQRDAFEDRKPRIQTSANEVKDIKRMRIFTENVMAIWFHISAVFLIALFFINTSKFVCENELARCTWGNLRSSANHSLALQRFCLLLSAYLTVSCKPCSRYFGFGRRGRAEEVSSGQARGKRTVSRRLSATTTETLVPHRRKSERSSSWSREVTGEAGWGRRRSNPINLWWMGHNWSCDLV